MKTTNSYIDTKILSVVLSVFLFIAMPLQANQMWQEMFSENLEAAEAGEVEAQYEVGIMYLKGQGIQQDRKKGIQWLKKASDAGNQQATSKLSRIKEQQNKFVQLLKQAKSGKLKAQYEVGMMYLKGKGVDKDGKKARQWLGRAADKGDAKSITRLGIINYKGEAGKNDYKQALKQFNRVGEKSALAQYYLGEMYSNGAGVKKDYKIAIDWYKKAAASGFDRAQGKIINLEEEIRVQSLRKKNAAQAKKRQKEAELKAKKQRVAKKASANKPVVVASAAKPSPGKVKKKKTAVKKSAPKAVKLSALDKLATGKWKRGKKPVEYLPSKVTECDQEKGSLVCLSKVLKRDRGPQTVEYRVKSIVKSKKDSYVIVYRNLVLDVTSSEETGDQTLGYDDEVEQGYKVKTGWGKAHTVNCERSKANGLKCVKDQTHKMNLVSGK